MRIFPLLVLASSLAFSGTPVSAQAPQGQPLVQLGNFAYLGTFSLPDNDGAATPIPLAYGGKAVGIGPDGASLYYGCYTGTLVARVTIPPIGGMASVVEPCLQVPNLSAVNPGDPNGIQLGGTLSWNGRLVASAYAYYDANDTAVASHFAGPDAGQLVGPFRVGADKPGFVGGYMGVVPTEWRALLGGPALTGQCCISILSRTSFGPSASVFDPSTLGTGTTPSRMVVGYPVGHETIGSYRSTGTHFNGSTTMGGVAFPAGTRSVLFIGRHGSSFCYGNGTSNPALHMQPDPSGGPGDVLCYDPTDPYKGPHGYPYRHQVWAYDANDLALVARGAKNPWDVLPYGVWTLTDIDGGNGTATMRSATYDPATRRLYVVVDTGGAPPTVHVYEITNAVLQPVRTGPRGFAVNSANGAWSFSWQPPGEAGWTGYQLEGGTTSGRADVGTIPLPASASSLTVPAPPGGTFFVRVRASYPDGNNPGSNEIVVTGGTPTSTPVPTGVTATSTGTSLVVSWSGAVGAAVSDVLLDAGTAPGLSNLVSGVSIGGSGSFGVGGLPPGHYYLRLRGVGPGGVSAVSNEAHAIVGGNPVGDLPGPPDGFRASASDRTVTLTWHPPESGPPPTSYLLDVGLRSGAFDLMTGVVLPAATRFVVPDVPPGTYYLRLRIRQRRRRQRAYRRGATRGAVADAVTGSTARCAVRVPSPARRAALPDLDRQLELRVLRALVGQLAVEVVFPAQGRRFRAPLRLEVEGAFVRRRAAEVEHVALPSRDGRAEDRPVQQVVRRHGG